MNPRSNTIINYGLLAGTGLIWGSQFLLIKLSLESFSPASIASLRVLIGALTLSLILVFGFEKVDTTQPAVSFWRSLPDFILIGFLEGTLPLLLVAWAQLYLDGSVTAVLIGTVPLFTTLLEFLFVRESRISARKVIGVSIGFLGIVVLVGPAILTGFTSRASGGVSMLLPALAALTAALCFASALLLIRIRLGSRFGPIRSAQGILWGSALTIFPVALWFAKPWQHLDFHPSLRAVLALLALGIFCGGLVYTLFVVLINRAGPAFASMSNYLVPLIGAFLGIFISGEKPASTLIAALCLILVSLWLSSDRETQSS